MGVRHEPARATEEGGDAVTRPAKSAAKITWAVDLLAPQPHEMIVELGCGRGAAAALICSRLEAATGAVGRLEAVDRSATAVERTRFRNAEHLASGRLRVHRAEIADTSAVAPPARVDAVLAVDVNAFWTRTADRELEAIAGLLRPGGRLLLLYGPAPAGADRILAAVSAAVRTAAGGAAFNDVREVRAEVGCGVLAHRAG
jgi:SAM-dependent methyltransferase